MGHIQISHRDVTPRLAIFHLPDWTPRGDNPSRSRREAFELARRVAVRAQTTPTEFGNLARELSDDVATRDRGGEIGGIKALTLARWPEFLDAWAALNDGDVSRVIETEFGFHVLIRRAPPAEARLSAERIIISYDEAPWLGRYLARRPVAARSRAEALALAEALSQRLREHPEQFADAVEQYSDHRDALRGGDLGEWSTREPTPWFRELELLRELDVGQVSRPLDSPFGVQILRRTSPRPRVVYSAAKLERGYDATKQDGAPGSLTAVQRELAQLSAQLSVDPSQFDVERGRSCCATPESWVEGRGNVFLEAALAKLGSGELGRAPVVLDTKHVALLRRLEPAPPPDTSARVGLPEPPAPNVEWLMSSYGSEALLRAVYQRVRAALPLDSALSARFSDAAATAAPFLSASGVKARLRAFRDHQAELERALGPERFIEYRAIFEAYLAERLLRVREAAAASAAGGLRRNGWPLL
jgi:hypothetical protein